MKVKVISFIAIILMVVSLSVVTHAADAVVIHDNEDVLQTTDGKVYVGQGISINGAWITLFNVRYPVQWEGKLVGAATFPADKVSMVYHKGAINQAKPTQQ